MLAQTIWYKLSMQPGTLVCERTKKRVGVSITHTISTISNYNHITVLISVVFDFTDFEVPKVSEMVKVSTPLYKLFNLSVLSSYMNYHQLKIPRYYRA